MDELRKVMSLLIETGTLPYNYHPHKLKGKGGNVTWECHIQPDWLLVWEQHDEELIMLMLDTGTHSDLF
jgi:mRNA interferase YafQ